VPNIPDSQGATLFFNGVQLGVLQGAKPAFAAGGVQEVTSMRSPVLGSGQNARVLKQYNCTSIEPGTMQCSFLGAADLARNDVGGPGTLVFSWPDGEISGQAFCSDLQADFTVGQVRQWTATFTFTGFDA
jgi:hypothetical protein